MKIIALTESEKFLVEMEAFEIAKITGDYSAKYKTGHENREDYINSGSMNLVGKEFAVGDIYEKVKSFDDWNSRIQKVQNELRVMIERFSTFEAPKLTKKKTKI